jgi:hypothetical protein
MSMSKSYRMRMRDESFAKVAFQHPAGQRLGGLRLSQCSSGAESQSLERAPPIKGGISIG